MWRLESTLSRKQQRWPSDSVDSWENDPATDAQVDYFKRLREKASQAKLRVPKLSGDPETLSRGEISEAIGELKRLFG